MDWNEFLRLRIVIEKIEKEREKLIKQGEDKRKGSSGKG